MERNTIKEMKEILEAINQGKKVEAWSDYYGKWFDGVNIPNFRDFTYRIKPESKETLLTNRELAKWLAQGNGQVSFDDDTKNFGKDTDGNRFKAMCSAIDWTYFGADDFFVNNVLIRKWDDTEWHKPTREYLGLEDT